MFSLDGRTALVTGASRGIGAACARGLDAAGARVALVARTQHRLTEVAADLRNDPVVIVDDLADEASPSRIADTTLATIGPPDVIVNNAAIGARRPSIGLSGEEIDALYTVNVRNLLLLTTNLVGSMAERGSGSVIGIGSVSGIVGTPNRAAYAATKGALDAMTRSLAMEFGPSGLRFNTVAPGVVVTDMWTENLAKDGVEESIVAQTALRRLAVPEDVAAAVVFLASDAASYITAQTLAVDGGLGHTLDLYG